LIRTGAEKKARGIQGRKKMIASGERGGQGGCSLREGGGGGWGVSREKERRNEVKGRRMTGVGEKSIL